MNRRNSSSQMEGSTPGLLPYESKVLCYEARKLLSLPLQNRNLAGVEINMAPDYPLVPVSRKLYSLYDYTVAFLNGFVA